MTDRARRRAPDFYWAALALVFVFFAVASHHFAPRYQAIGPPVLSWQAPDVAAGWQLIGQGVLDADEAGLRLGLQKPDAETAASRDLILPPSVHAYRVSAQISAEQLVVHGPPYRSGGKLVAVALRSGEPDFGRPMEIAVLGSDVSAANFESVLSHRRGDDLHRLQLQLIESTGEVMLSALQVTPVVATPLWRGLILFASLSLAVVVLSLFWPWLRLLGQQLHATLAVVGVAGIIAGCSMPAAIKVAIYSALSGPFEQWFGAGGSPGVAHQVLVGEHGLFFSAAHFGFFAGTTLMALLARVEMAQQTIARLLCLAMVSEGIQVFVPDRGPGVDDVLVDWAGVALGTLLFVLFRRMQREGLLSH